MIVILKCRKCRHELVRETATRHIVVSFHGERLDLHSKDATCSNSEQDSLYFLEETGTPWISDIIEKCDWTKGKLNCPNCEARVGSFDFVSQSKCACGSALLPAVHLVKSKVDTSFQDSNVLTSLKT
ncbi:E3 ubiquitin-protein ligase RNF180-like [Thrips palmi]|uniref:E3 ubiquitin-protein ligase RNF180-like n=1 Tax=Thrips palmi TaxID=161013 RepID=A0A6P8ZBD4_THRPL|nr:E3 ubiquitin-protein ligase RNF180-like [Thrips palmi]